MKRKRKRKKKSTLTKRRTQSLPKPKFMMLYAHRYEGAILTDLQGNSVYNAMSFQRFIILLKRLTGVHAIQSDKLYTLSDIELRRKK